MSAEPEEFVAAEPPAKTVIVGCQGRMGKMLSQRARAAGLEVSGVDQPLEPNAVKSACADATLALLCVPAAHLEETLGKIAPFLAQNAIMADITSVKEAPMRQMEKHWPGAVVGTHPLFGPQAAPDSDLPVAIIAGKNVSATQTGEVAAFFRKFGCRVFKTTASQHDKAMAKIQNMNFITNLAYFAAIAGQRDLLPFLTPSFERRKQAAAKMLTEDAEMFTGLFEANPHSHEAVRQYRKMLNLAASGDIDLLCHRAQWWWQPEQD